MKRQDLKSMTIEELESIVSDLGEKKYRARQIFKAIHCQLVRDIGDISGLSKDFRQELSNKYEIYSSSIERCLKSKLDGTRKYLFRLSDGNVIESVFMKYRHGNSVCISTQVGCRMGCEFCASTKRGLVRDLSAGEILDQYYQMIRDTGERIGNIVLMGSGEPFDNFDNFKRFLELIHDPEGQNMSYRNITVSTSGIVPRIYELADLGIPVNLAISLHNPFNVERSEIMPIGKKYSIEDLVDSCSHYISKTGRRVTFEYALIRGENDSESYADKLIDILRDINCHVNLIPLNPIAESNMEKSKGDDVIRFKKRLEGGGVNATVRRELGSDIEAACGQLRIDYLESEI